MGYVCGKLAAHAFAGVLFRNVQNHKHRACHAFFMVNGIGDNLEITSFPLEQLLTVLPGK